MARGMIDLAEIFIWNSQNTHVSVVGGAQGGGDRARANRRPRKWTMGGPTKGLIGRLFPDMFFAFCFLIYVYFTSIVQFCFNLSKINNLDP